MRRVEEGHAHRKQAGRTRSTLETAPSSELLQRIARPDLRPRSAVLSALAPVLTGPAADCDRHRTLAPVITLPVNMLRALR